MGFVYSVRCNFKKAELEDAWNEWYSGPKLVQMLAKPMFKSGQRFKASSMNQRRQYLALWVVESPEAFKTKEYTSDWGFFEWAPHIGDWSRDLYGPPEGDATEMFAVGPEERLYLASFDELSNDEASEILTRIEAKRPGVTWLWSVGLDQHSPILGLRRLKAGEQEPEPLGEEKVQETIFSPISPCKRARWSSVR